jgi:thiol-disulfide isomerase/thioredoxin
MSALVENFINDERPEIAKMAATEGFKLRIDSARNATAEAQVQMIDELKVLLSDREFDRDAYSLAYGLARAIGYSDSSEVAASLYEDMSAMMSESEDERLRDRAPKMMGAARRMRLPGNFMDVMGQTTDGEEFDWEAYRGKVVLVDFWASWCGPCRGEVPNMKRNLASYGERGFDIVGVNLDNSLAACEKYVEQEELPWGNLMSDKDGQRGWDNPLATHYGISAIPTAILVDQEGKVVSLRARGKELDRLLAEMLGEPEPTNVEDAGEAEPEKKVAEK